MKTERGCTFVLYSLSRREVVKDARVGSRNLRLTGNLSSLYVLSLKYSGISSNPAGAN
jgi:hypothetical protein